ncbi:Cof-type HAD-IIB family hydrolase [Sphingomonas sp.]|uniref:Cof-type HAD-IIB family hydrolase n=1 Tax=Sphingomonas sp. TaxID=28214 RepID=UPI0035BBAADD
MRLVVSDVDGTLVDKQKQLTPATIAAVGRLRDAGVRFTIISARPRSGMMPIVDALELDVPMGAFNGGTVFTRDGAILFEQHLAEDVSREVLELARGVAVETWVFAKDRWYATDGEGPHTKSERITSNQEPVVRADFSAMTDGIDKITFVSDDEPLLRALTAKVKAQIGEDRATIVQSQTYYLDVTAPAANKGDGIVKLAQALGAALTDTIAIGDQANDLAMFARAGRSIAMGQGPQAVRDAADAVTLGNDEDGVANAIDHMILEQKI